MIALKQVSHKVETISAQEGTTVTWNYVPGTTVLIVTNPGLPVQTNVQIQGGRAGSMLVVRVEGSSSLGITLQGISVPVAIAGGGSRLLYHDGTQWHPYSS